jgi:hypothetical protein
VHSCLGSIHARNKASKLTDTCKSHVSASLISTFNGRGHCFAATTIQMRVEAFMGPGGSTCSVMTVDLTMSEKDHCYVGLLLSGFCAPPH